MSQLKVLKAGLGLVLGLALSSGAWAQAVMQTVTVKVNPGQMAAYQAKVAALQGVMDRVGGGARLQLWNATAAGQATGTTLVAVGYPSLQSYADTWTKATADKEWQKIMGGLDSIRTVVSSGLMESRDGGGMPEPAKSGSVLQGILVRTKPGQVGSYVQKVEALKKIQKRVGATGSTRVWQATLAGQQSGLVAVGLVHPSLADYASNTEKMQADAEWQKIIGGLDSIRTIASSSLFVAP